MAKRSAVLAAGIWLAMAATGGAALENKPLSPEQEKRTFALPPGFRIDLVAAEPDVVDPVAMAFDERGNLYVVEMPGYPNGGLGDGPPNHPGTIKLLADRNRDGRFEKVTTFAANLRFPTGVCCWRGGVLVCDAPDILFLKDADGDGTADVRRVLYSGFGTRNIQQLPNGLQFHWDNWIHGCNGSNETNVVSPESPESPAVALRGRHFRFQPDRPASLEPMSGGGQYGLAADDYGRWFTCTNSQHLRQIVLPDEYLRHNPDVLVRAAAVDIPDGVDGHHAAAKLFRASKFEAWRVERTTRRFNDPKMRTSLPASELTPGGYTTSATGVAVDRGGVFSGPYAGCIFAGDPANNLVHADRLDGPGPQLVARRVEPDREFLTSADGWFRPVFLAGGPDGCLYLCDFYRPVIETPLSLPDDIKATLDLETQRRGRIWRIAPEQFAPTPFEPIDRIPSFKLVETLAHPNAWRRLAAQRLLIERNPTDPDTISNLRSMAASSPFELGRLHALWTLDGLGKSDPALIAAALTSIDPGVRAAALRLAEKNGFDRIDDSLLTALANDPAPIVRFQLGLTLSVAPKRSVAAVKALCDHGHADPWLSTAALMAVKEDAIAVFDHAAKSGAVSREFVQRLAQKTAARMPAERRQAFFNRVVRRNDLDSAQRFRLAAAVLTVPNPPPSPQSPLPRGEVRKNEGLADSPVAAELFLDAVRAARLGRDADIQLAAVELLAHAPAAADAAVGALADLIDARQPVELQRAAIRSLARRSDPKVGELLIERFQRLLPASRREIAEALFARPARLQQLLTAMEEGGFNPSDLEPARREQLLAHSNPSIRDRAKNALANLVAADRRIVLEDYAGVAALQGDVGRGRTVFEKHCATCHRLAGIGRDVGPDLHAALKNQTLQSLLVNILDPSREVDGRYVNYIVDMTDGRVVTGIIASESASAIVLKRADAAEDVLPREQIETIRSTGKSLMPEGLEKEVGKQAMADVIAFLLSQKE